MGEPPLTIHAWMRYDLVRRALRGLDDVSSVLEIGAGEGALGVRLARRYRYVGLERDELSFATARRRFERAGVASIVLGDLGALAPGEIFDLVCAFEVLEHYEDDEGALRAWLPRLRPRGWLLLSVPAFARRWGAWDVKAGHHRRYEREGLASILEAAGLSPVSIEAYGFPLGSLLELGRHALAARGSQRRPPHAHTAESGRVLQPPERLGWLTWAASAPGRLAQRRYRHGERGTGFVALARAGR